MQGLPDKAAAAEAANFDSALNVMFLAAFPLLLWVFQGSFTGIATALLEIWLFSMALRLISRGQKVQREYELAEVADRPALPRKLLGSVLIGVMVLILAGHQFQSLLLPLLSGLAATGLSILAFGLDPLRDKGMDDPAVIARMECEAAQEALSHRLDVVADQVAALQDAELIRRTDRARDLIDRLMQDTARDADSFARIRKPIETFAHMLSEEVQRLLDSAEGSDFTFARRRYMAKLQVMTESFSTHARKKGYQAGRDAFEREADNLLNRMPRESAA